MVFSNISRLLWVKPNAGRQKQSLKLQMVRLEWRLKCFPPTQKSRLRDQYTDEASPNHIYLIIFWCTYFHEVSLRRLLIHIPMSNVKSHCCPSSWVFTIREQKQPQIIHCTPGVYIRDARVQIPVLGIVRLPGYQNSSCSRKIHVKTVIVQPVVYACIWQFSSFVVCIPVKLEYFHDM